MASQPSPMGTNKLNPTKGWPNGSALDCSHPISANVLYDLVPGQCCHLNDSGELEPGVKGWQMPFWLFGGAGSLDVMNTPGENWWPIVPGGKVACFPGVAQLELWTTEFDDDQDYLPNQPLRAPTGNTALDEGTSGRLTNQITYTIADTIANSSHKWNAIVGITTMPTVPTIMYNSAAPTTPKYTNVNGVSVLAFYPVYYPGHPTE